MKKYIFFIREYNDWDNIAPIVYYLAKNITSKICICFYNTDQRETALFKYLNEHIGKNLEVFYLRPKKLDTIFNYGVKIVNKLLRISKLGLNLKTYKDQNIKDKILTKWFKAMNLKSYARIIFVFDRTVDSIIKQVKNQSEDLDCLFVSCPHGPMTNINRMMYTHQFKKIKNLSSLRAESNEDIKKYFQYYNYLLFTDHIESKYNKEYCTPNEENFKDKAKIKVLGSIRYCKEWLDHVSNFTPEVQNKNNGKLKAVFFMKKFQHNVFKEEVYRTLRMFALFPNIDFYIKPHTRGMNFSTKSNANNIHIVNDQTSSYLIDMCDVVLFYGGTSIILEAIAKKKLIACVDYLDANINVFDYFKACHSLRCRDDLSIFLDSLSAGKTLLKKDDENLVKEIIYAGDYSTSVSQRYVDFFKSL